MADDQDGFTLIELLVVVIIIGILAAIAIPAFLSQRERAWVASGVSDTRNAAMQIESFLAANGNYPNTLTTPVGTTTELCSDRSSGAVGSCATARASITTSDGIALRITTAATSYTIAACHVNFDGDANCSENNDFDADERVAFWDSTAGGLQ